MSANIFRIIVGTVLTVAIVWALVLGWWQSNDYVPTSAELMLHLLALPLALVGGYWLLRISIDQLKGKSKSGATASQPDADKALLVSQAEAMPPERAYSLSVVEAFAVTAGGASADEILAAVMAGKSPKPKSNLTDSSGFPVFAAVSDELDMAAIAEELGDSPPGLRKLLERDDALRAVGLLGQVLRPACDLIMQLAVAAEPSSGKLNLRLLCLMPKAWKEGDLADLQPWLRSLGWPPDEVAELHIQAVPVASDLDAMLQVDAMILDANQEADGKDEKGHLLILIAGAMSAVTQDSIAEREATVGLFSWQDQDRPIPGEGAAAILFAPKAICAELNLTECVTVSRVVHVVRDKPSAGGQERGKLIDDLLSDLLNVSGIAAEDVKSAISDTDHRSEHAAEIQGGLGTAFPQLDPLKDCSAIGTVNGCLTPLGGLLALACACHRARADQVPTLCLSNQHDLERIAMLVRPADSTSASETSSTPKV